MEKDAFQFLANQAIQAAGKAVAVDEDKTHTFLVGEDTREFIPQNIPDELQVSSLRSIVDFVLNSSDLGKKGQVLIEICSPREVRVEGLLDQWGRRARYMVAEPENEEFHFHNWYDREELNIALQSQFVPNDDQATLLKFIGNYQESTDQTATDDGITQVAAVRTGAASVGNVKVPNPVTLMPYRTFPEVKQSESQFVFRMHEGMKGALFEADGGAWRNDAIQTIKKYFGEELTPLISRKQVVVIG
ncbi:MAG TPA: hypothetical protein H9875_08545 [Candidatus Levilactobacillus faecigallinarum]|uniref:Phage protein n=1 Tax=Candidatus Levilactobacillus faecigallinarum TaxID=2838638 RepID=A0A9D1U5N8_9LACO|nr:hypothetical protein [Candidatus Levilactobacillus faecigallinarum]